jgi:hypothetical protein
MTGTDSNRPRWETTLAGLGGALTVISSILAIAVSLGSRAGFAIVVVAILALGITEAVILYVRRGRDGTERQA